MPVTIFHPASVFTVTDDGKSNPLPSGYGKRFVPLKSRKSGRDHVLALSRLSARYSNRTVTSPTPRGRIRQVSGSILSQASEFPDCSAEKLETSRAKLSIS